MTEFRPEKLLSLLRSTNEFFMVKVPDAYVDGGDCIYCGKPCSRQVNCERYLCLYCDQEFTGKEKYEVEKHA